MEFSIITPTHNRGHLIAETIRSVLKQTHSDFEQIIIDDGSTDDTETVVKSFGDERIQYHKLEKQAHRSVVRNEGLRRATGDLVCFLDSDDLWPAEKLEKVHAVFVQYPDLGFVFHQIRFIPQGILPDPKFPYAKNIKGNFFLDMLRGKFHAYPVFTIPRPVLEQVGLLDETMLDGQLDLYLRIAARYEGLFIADKLIEMRKHDGNISRNYDMRHMMDFLQTIDMLRSSGDITQKIYTEAQSMVHQKIGYFYYTERAFDTAAGHFIKSFKTGSGTSPIKSLVMIVRSYFRKK